MKKFVYILAIAAMAVCAARTAYAADYPGGRVSNDLSRVVRATVFLHGAEVTRTSNVRVTPGGNAVVFGNLPANVTPESVIARASGAVRILSANYRVNHLEKPELAEQTRKLNDELRRTRDERARTSDRMAVLEAEQEFLRKNSSIAGDSGIRLDELRGINEYYRGRLTDITTEKFAVGRRLEELDREIERLTAALGTAADDGRKSVGEILVDLAAEREENIEVTVSYYVPDAGWTPFYELRAADLDAPVNLIGKGHIYQTTGEDWRDIPVILSSGAPAFGGVQPLLTPWYLDFAAPLLPQQRAYGAFNKADAEVEAVMMEEPAAVPMALYSGKSQKPYAQQAQTSVEFVLPSPISVPSNNDGYTAEIMNTELPAKYEHYSVRKLDRDVFVLAKIEGWEKLNILAGDAGIFLGNTYVGTSYVDPRRADDVMEISLGRDSGVIVTREKGRDVEGTTFLGMSNKVTREWIVTVRNTRQNAIDIRLLDQIPVPVNTNIKVEAVELSGAEHDKDKGELSWELHLEPGESAERRIKYSVTYPKDKELTLE